MLKALGIPLGPADADRFERYEREFVPQLAAIGWLPAIELKTDRINEDQEWVRRAVAFCEKYDAPLQWHADNIFFSMIGRGLVIDDAIKYLSKADWLVRGHGCRIVMHFGTYNWPTFDRDTPEPIFPPLDVRRFQCPIGAEEYLEQMKAHVPFMTAIAKHYSDPSIILGENNHICLIGVAQYNAMQCSTAQFIIWLAKQTRISTLLDIEHYYELDWLVSSRGIARRIRTNINRSVELTPAQKEVVAITGIKIEKGKSPGKSNQFLDFEPLVEAMKPQCFHISGTKDSLNERGAFNGHLPIDGLETAEAVQLPSVIRYINQHGGSMIVEANGANFWLKAGYPCGLRIYDDEEAKYVTLKTTLELIKRMS